MNKKLSFKLLKNPVHFLALGFGSGLAPKAPGTFGTLMAVLIYLAIKDLELSLFLSIVTFVTIVGVFICERSSKLLGVHDHPGIVWDEFAGFFITMIAVPFDWLWLLLGFILFRFFDIVKPWPIKAVDAKMPGGLGIMMDDVIAGVFAGLCLHSIIWLSAYV